MVKNSRPDIVKKSISIFNKTFDLAYRSCGPSRILIFSTKYDSRVIFELTTYIQRLYHWTRINYG